MHYQVNPENENLSRTTSLSIHFLMLLFFFFSDPAPTEIYPLSLHDALPICITAVYPSRAKRSSALRSQLPAPLPGTMRSEEHTSELQSRFGLSHAVLRL